MSPGATPPSRHTAVLFVSLKYCRSQKWFAVFHFNCFRQCKNRWAAVILEIFFGVCQLAVRQWNCRRQNIQHLKSKYSYPSGVGVLHVHVHLHIYVCTYIYVCKCIITYLYVYTYIFTSAYAYHTYVCTVTYLLVYTYIFISVHV